MRVYELFHALIEKFVPMNEQTKLELQSGALEWYNKQRDLKAIREAENKRIVEENEVYAGEPDYTQKPTKKPTVVENIFTHLEAWYSRYAMAIAFIFLVPFLKKVINGELSSQMDDDDSEDDTDDYDDYMDYKRFSKRKK